MNSTLQVVTELNPDAIDIARRLDVERENGKIRGFVPSNHSPKRCSTIVTQYFRPLHGLPIIIKGNIGVADKMNATGNFLEFFTPSSGISFYDSGG